MKLQCSRPIGRLFYLAAMILITAAGLRAADAPATTLIHDTIYRANGTPAKGTLVITWPAFESVDHRTVAAGTLTVTLADGGLLDVPLAPNQGATPVGTYYRVVTKLDDGTTTTEFWNVPNISPATVASVRTTLQAGPAQAPTQNYVLEAEVSSDPLPDKIPRADANGKLAEAWIPNTVSTPLHHDSATDILSCPSCVTTDGNETIAGRKTFSQPPLGVTGGANANIQFNSNGVLAGDANMAWDATTGLTINRAYHTAGTINLPPSTFLFDVSPTITGSAVGPNGFAPVHGEYPTVNASTFAGGETGWFDGGVALAIQDTSAVGWLEGLHTDSMSVSGPAGSSLDRLMSIHLEKPSKSGSVTVTDNAGIWIEPQQNVAANNYGVYVADQGSGANDYSIYSAGGKNYFGGPISAASISAASVSSSFIESLATDARLQARTASAGGSVGLSLFHGGAAEWLQKTSSSDSVPGTLLHIGSGPGNGSISDEYLTLGSGVFFGDKKLAYIPMNNPPSTTPESVIRLLGGANGSTIGGVSSFEAYSYVDDPLTLENSERVALQTNGAGNCPAGTHCLTSVKTGTGTIRPIVISVGSDGAASEVARFDSTSLYPFQVTGTQGKITSSGSYGTLWEISNTDTGGRKWQFLSTGHNNSGGAGNLAIVPNPGAAFAAVLTPAGLGIGKIPSLAALDVDGGAAFNGAVSTTSYVDVTEIAAPANPPAGAERWYASSTTHQLSCRTSTGGNCAPAAATSGYALFFGSSTGTSMAACSNGGGSTSFIGLGGASSTTEANIIRFLVPVSGTLKNFNVKLSGNVPASESAAFKISKNGSTVGTPAVTVGGGASTGTQDTNTATAVAAGDLISVAVTCSGGTTALTGPVTATVMVQ